MAKKEINIVEKPKLTMAQILAKAQNTEEETKGERYFSRKFAKMYAVHKVMVELRRAKAGKRDGTATITAEEAYNTAKELFAKALEE